LGFEPALDQIFQQRFARRSVLGRAFAQPQWVFGTLNVDPDGGQHHMFGEMHSVNQQCYQLELPKIAPHRISQSPLVPTTKRSLTALLLMPWTATSCGSGSSECA